MSSSSSLPNPPQPSPSHSAILFSGTLVRRLESDPSLRLPSTYIGVRRVRASRSTASVPSTAATAVGTGKRKRGGLDDDGTKEGVGEKDDGEIGDNVVDDASSSQAEAFTTTTSTNNDNNDDDDDGQIVYKVTNPDGTQRRMNTKEKKQLKYALKVAKLKAKKEERQRKHHEMILEAKAGKRERKRLKNLAWREKQRKRQQQEQEQQQQGQQQGQPQQPQQKQQQQEGEKQHQIQQQGQQPQSTKEKVTQIKDQKSSTPPEQAKKEDDVVDAQPPATLSLLEEELASFRGERRGIPPVMLTPAATLVAQHHGVLSPTTAAAAATTATTTKTKTKTIMDPHLSEQWARQLQRSMIPAEISRSKEDMRPMAYKLVPEVWKSLCPPSLWSADASSTSIDNEGRPGDDGDDDPKDGHKTEEGAQETTSTDSKSTSNPSSSSSPLPPTTTNTALVQLRNPSPSYDTDASLIFQHLHQHSPHLHIACGALFGCDFLLYDGKRDERHSFAGMRIYSTTSHNNSDNDSSGEEKTTTTITKFPIPSAYDMAGFVRTMNTARKIALVATVVRERINDGKVARVVIVDLALEKILTAQTHIRKGTTEKRKSEEEKASGLAKTK